VIAADPLVDYLLRLGDDDLILGQRLGELAGKGPIVEEDLAASNVALDLLGQARLWLTYAGEREGRGRDEDAFAFFRAPNAFTNLLLVEQPNGSYAQTIARQFLFDTRHFFALQGLCASSDERVAGIAQKGVREVAYHVRRSSDWVIRLGDGTDESRIRMQAAIDELWTYTGEMFTGDAVDAAMAASGVGVAPESLREPWREHVAQTLAEATLTMPADGFMRSGGRSGKHTEQMSYLLAEMQSVRRSIPGDVW
jgi:ring-1,2-phenylacetyl-CoA epoxidase subunit PaaC